MDTPVHSCVNNVIPTQRYGTVPFRVGIAFQESPEELSVYIGVQSIDTFYGVAKPFIFRTVQSVHK